MVNETSRLRGINGSLLGAIQMNELIVGSVIMLYGGLGAQLDYQYPVGNSYGWEIGEAGVSIKTESGFTAELFHLSGVNTEELDCGINAVFVGYEVSNKYGLFAESSIGYNFVNEITTNEYGHWLFRNSVGVRYHGLYFRGVSIDEMKYISTGFTVEF